jgi:hypothetical protein
MKSRTKNLTHNSLYEGFVFATFVIFVLCLVSNSSEAYAVTASENKDVAEVVD